MSPLLQDFLAKYARSDLSDGMGINRRCGKAIQAILRERLIENTEEERTFNN